MKKLLCFVIILAISCAFVSCKDVTDGDHTHEYSEWETLKAASCTEAGERTRSCDCGDKQTESIAILPHTEETIASKEPSCSETGLTEGKRCSVCETVLVAQETVATLEHTYDGDLDESCNVCGHEREVICPHANTTVLEGREADCTEAGLTEGSKCTDCGEVLVPREVIAAKGHTEVIDAAKDATCSATGLTEGKHCDVCKEVLLAQTPTPKIDHTYDDKYDESCNSCGFIRDAECAHINTTTLNAKAPTCIEAGLTEGKVCQKCEVVITAQEIIPAKGHTEVVDTPKTPTCTETGLTEGKHCDVCDTVLIAQSLVPANGHTEVKDKAVAPTCTEPGLTEGKHCSVCEEILVEQTAVDTVPHSYDKGVCSSCGAEDPDYVEPFDPSGVTYEDYDKMTPSEKQSFYNKFGSYSKFMEWFTAAKEEYDKQHQNPSLGEDGEIDLGGGN